MNRSPALGVSCHGSVSTALHGNLNRGCFSAFLRDLDTATRLQMMGRPRYFTPSEVAAHNTAEDLWVSFLGKVYDLSPLMSQYKGEPQQVDYCVTS